MYVPLIANILHSDTTLTQPLFTGYLPPTHLPALDSHLTTLGAEAISPQIREWSADAERNQPYVKGFNVWGDQYGVDRLVTSEGWKQLAKWGAKNGFVQLSFPISWCLAWIGVVAEGGGECVAIG
jgi:hypothetical protein